MNPVQLGPVASTFLVVFYMVAALVLIVLTAVVAYLLFRLNTVLNEYQAKIDPLLAKADRLLDTTEERVSILGEQAEEVLVQGEALAQTVHDTVDRTATVVTHTVNAPRIQTNALKAGVQSAWATFRTLQRAPAKPPPFAVKTYPATTRVPSERTIADEATLTQKSER
jgi:hypothetical protein